MWIKLTISPSLFPSSNVLAPGLFLKARVLVGSANQQQMLMKENTMLQF